MFWGRSTTYMRLMHKGLAEQRVGGGGLNTYTTLKDRSTISSIQLLPCDIELAEVVKMGWLK
jgi:hypothetical protein